MQDYTDTRPSPLCNYLGEPGTRPPPWVAPFVTMKPRVPDTTAMVPMAPPAQSSLYPLLEKEKLGQTKASPPARGPGLD